MNWSDYLVQGFPELQKLHGEWLMRKLYLVLCFIATVIVVLLLNKGNVNQRILPLPSSVNFTLVKTHVDINKIAIGVDNWHKVSFQEVLKMFSERTLDTCENRNVNMTDVGLDYWNKILLKGSFQIYPFLTNRQYIYDFEKEYLSYPPLVDKKQLPDPTSSKVTMFGAEDGIVRCNLGDVVTGRVDLVDGYGQHRQNGGDEVRLWLVDKENSGFRAAGHVTDLKNGSYQLTAWCLWPGKIQVNVAVAYPREYIRSVIHQTHLSISRYMFGKFSNNSTEEVAVCWSLPNIIESYCVCNFTHLTGQSFYCGRPRNKKLSCSDYSATSTGPMIQPRAVTPSERELIKNIPTRQMLKYSIPNDITLLADAKGKAPDLKPCSETSFNVTWDLVSRPLGFWKPTPEWSNLQCYRPTVSASWVMNCLKDNKVWIFGDSNAIRIFDYLNEVTKCGPFSVYRWSAALSCTTREANITLAFTPHELPLYQHAYWTPRLGFKSVADYIDSIPSAGKYIIVVHYFLHAMPSHLSVVHERLKALKEAVARVVNRNPDVMFAFRGPHVTSFDLNINHAIGGDNLARFYVNIIQETFRDLRNKILYLDGWEMTLAIENPDIHPTNKVAEGMAKTLLAFRCNESGFVPRT